MKSLPPPPPPTKKPHLLLTHYQISNELFLVITQVVCINRINELRALFGLFVSVQVSIPILSTSYCYTLAALNTIKK